MDIIYRISCSVLAILCISCSSAEQNESKEEERIVIDKIAHSFGITPRLYDGKMSLQYQTEDVLHYNDKGDVVAVERKKTEQDLATESLYQTNIDVQYLYDNQGNITKIVGRDKSTNKMIIHRVFDYNYSTGLLVKFQDLIEETTQEYEYHFQHNLVSTIKNKEKGQVVSFQLVYNEDGYLVVVNTDYPLFEDESFSISRKMDLLYANFEYGAVLSPWVNTKNKWSAFKFNDQMWEMTNSYPGLLLDKTHHEVRYEEKGITYVHLYVFSYKKIRIKGE
ncbi:hypothetical protein [Myroides odoratus]|uniref:hypothetical protein n=1 Tax=Myroides odoratus TaxID=256 RepID=UPI00333E7348